MLVQFVRNPSLCFACENLNANANDQKHC
jgi:hypothetical protein